MELIDGDVSFVLLLETVVGQKRGVSLLLPFELTFDE